MASQQYDIFAVTIPASDADFYVTTTKPTGAADLSLAATIPGQNGVGYKVSITSDGDELLKGFVITGVASNGASITESIAGPDTSTVTTTNYFASVSGVSVNAATAGNVTVGYSATTAITLPMTRIKGLYYVGATNAGSLVVTRQSDSRVLLDVKTPAGSNAFADSLYLAAEGIKVAKTPDDMATVVTTNLTATTLFCG
jgi:hypothetical protein